MLGYAWIAKKFLIPEKIQYKTNMIALSALIKARCVWQVFSEKRKLKPLSGMCAGRSKTAGLPLLSKL
jgi:hypothetical protein